MLSLLWNAPGATDYVLTNSSDEAHLSEFTSEQLACFTSFPAFATAAWAFGLSLAGIAPFGYARRQVARGALR